MVKDRLEELKRLCNCPPNNIRDTIIDIKANKIELQIEDILSEYTKIRQWIQTIRENIETMKRYIREMSQTFQSTSQKTLPENMEKLRLENMSLCQRVYSHMKEQEIDMPTADDCSVIARVKRLHFYSVREEFIVVWKHHEQFLSDYEERVKKTIQRHAKIVDAYITEEETESLIANKTTSIFVGNLLEQAESERNKLRELLVRHSELEKVERSLIEVRDMFLRISALVIEQSPLISQIEYFAHQATLNIDKGAEKLEKAREMKIKRMKWKIWFLFWLTIILTLIILILIFVD
ncbi:syntaxin-4 [Sitodiplosis mosellana]|uniref:syntaxin-4 n=1 Tax=Sitodiplosis mosellana TaxID=263140 RepID=UPI002444C685|nr:syntaxin-4 [Sitodiplosis mosellana]XP_055301094.1 syntaxin-4 [Sitodiplosis mosellana]